MSSIMTGSFKLIKSDNFESYLRSLGFDPKMRQVFSFIAPMMDIAKDGDVWHIKASFTDQNNTCRTTEIKFKMGELFNDIAGNGVPCKTVVTLEGNDKLFHEQRNYQGEVIAIIVTEFTETEMTITLKGSGNVVSTSIYERQQEGSQVTPVPNVS